MSRLRRRPQYEDDIKMKMTSRMKTTSKMMTTSKMKKTSKMKTTSKVKATSTYFYAKMTSAKLYIYIGVGARDLYKHPLTPALQLPARVSCLFSVRTWLTCSDPTTQSSLRTCFFFQCCAVFPSQLFPSSTKYVRCPPPLPTPIVHPIKKEQGV